MEYKLESVERTSELIFDNPEDLHNCIHLRNPEVPGIIVASIVVVNVRSRDKQMPWKERMKYMYEVNRLITFCEYPGDNKPFRTRLAQAGFIYTGYGDEVACYCCQIHVMNWSDADMPMEVHNRISSSCRFLTNNADVNYKSTSVVDFTRLQHSENEQVSLQVYNTYYLGMVGTLFLSLFRFLFELGKYHKPSLLRPF